MNIADKLHGLKLEHEKKRINRLELERKRAGELANIHAKRVMLERDVKKINTFNETGEKSKFHTILHGVHETVEKIANQSERKEHSKHKKKSTGLFHGTDFGGSKFNFQGGKSPFVK